MPVRLSPDPFTLAHGDVLLVDSIAAWLVAHGYSDEDILKLTSRNGLRVLAEVIG